MSNSLPLLDSKILIVDDDMNNVKLLEGMLQRTGYMNVTSTTDPTSVYDLHRQNNYDLILLDLLMPEMNGFQVMEALRKIETDNYLPVLVITAQPTQKRHAMQASRKSSWASRSNSRRP